MTSFCSLDLATVKYYHYWHKRRKKLWGEEIGWRKGLGEEERGKGEAEREEREETRGGREAGGES